MHEETYTHDHGDGHVHTHHHGDGHSHHHDHSHTHDPAEIKKIVNRLSKSIGHLESVKRMVEDGRDCSEVLIQLAAVRSALGSVSRIVLKDHIEHCVVDAVESHDEEASDALNHAIDHLFK